MEDKFVRITVVNNLDRHDTGGYGDGLSDHEGSPLSFGQRADSSIRRKLLSYYS